MRKNWRKLATAFATLSLGLFIAGCKTNDASDTVVSSNSVMNTNLGSDGFSFTPPAGYHKVDPASEEPSERDAVNLYRQILKRCKAVPQTEHKESHMYFNGSIAINFSFEVSRSGSSYDEESALIRSAMINWRPDGTPQDIEMSTFKGDTLGKTTTKLDENYIEEQYIIVDGRDMVRINGVAPIRLQSQLQADINALLNSLEF